MSDEPDDEGPGVPEWVVTYGDMMSLLLTFFIMLVSLSEVVAEEKYRAILDALQQYGGYQAGPTAPPGKNFPLNSAVKLLDIPQLGSSSDEELGTGGVKKKSTEGPDIRVFRMPEGQDTRAGDLLEFKAGNSELTPKAIEELKSIARMLAGKPQKLDLRSFTGPTAEGRTLQLRERIKLSYQRAENVQQFLETQGIDHNRIRISAYIADVDKQESVAGLAKTALDRVEVTVLDEFASEYVGRPDDY